MLKRNNFNREEVSQNSFNYFVQYEGFIFENTNYVFGARYDQYDEYESEFSPRFAIRTQINDNISSKISIGKGFKTPDYRQLYFNFSNSSSMDFNSSMAALMSEVSKISIETKLPNF